MSFRPNATEKRRQHALHPLPQPIFGRTPEAIRINYNPN